MSLTDHAICVRPIDFSETSQVVHLLTRAGGMVRLLAKGSKRAKSKSGGAIDFFSEGELVYAPGKGDNLGALMEFVESNSPRTLRRELPRLNAGLYMLELIGAMLPPSDPHPEAFDLLHNALVRLGQPDAAPPAVLAYFQWRLARHAGLLGDMSRCAACGQPAAQRGAAFSSSAGGLVCRACQPTAKDKFIVTADALSGLAILADAEAGKRPKLPDPPARAVLALLNYHLEYQLGRHLKTAYLVLK